MEAEDDLDDPERLMQCPYDKTHQIRACRFPYHLVKCRKSHPEVAKSLATCPFNARHLVPRADLGDHISKCRDKGFIEHDIAYCSSGFQRDEVNAVSTWQAPPCDEDWETELLEQPNSPFVWGTTNSGINSCSVTSAQKNYLPSSVRAPESSPYTASWKDLLCGNYMDRRESIVIVSLQLQAISRHFVVWVHGVSNHTVMGNPL
uniref:Gametocyte specific factor 1 n=1 Tax=Pavo cristatus TaxID=9049 RepID=A0A8C9L3I7_PAVCR